MMTMMTIAILLALGSICFAVASGAAKQKKEVEALLKEIETRDLRLATRWEGR